MRREFAVSDPVEFMVETSPDLSPHQAFKNTLPPGVTWNDPDKKFKLICSWKVPGILHANHDSRRAGLKLYDLAFAAQLGHPIYINFAQDILTFVGFGADLLFIGSTPKFGVSAKHLDSVQYAFVATAEPLGPDLLEWSCGHFRNLKHFVTLCNHSSSVSQRYLSDEELNTGQLSRLPSTCWPGSEWSNELWVDVRDPIMEMAGKSW